MRFEVSTTFHGMQSCYSPGEVLPFWGVTPIIATTGFKKLEASQVEDA
jgi:hypothetical protein